MVQDVFTTFLEKLDAFEGRSELRTWLFGILHRKVFERRRASYDTRRNDPIDQIFEDQFDAAGSWIQPASELQRLFFSNEIGSLIRDCMAKLSLSQREVFVLREIEGFETDGICKILALTVTNFGV